MNHLGVPIPFNDRHKLFYLLQRLITGPDLSRKKSHVSSLTENTDELRKRYDKINQVVERCDDERT